MSEHCRQESSCFDGLEAVHGIVTDELSHQKRIYSPYTQTSFGYTGEMEDENGLVYLRARYYNRNTGTFMSMDPYEGTPNRPMSLNGYAYAEGNPVNNTDPSGMTPVPSSKAIHTAINTSPQLVAGQLNSGMCLQSDCNFIERLLGLCSTPTPMPTASPCSMRDNNGVNVLAATAITESDGFGPLTQDDAAIAGLMMMQVNTFIATNEANWRELGTWTGAGQSPETIVADPTQTRITDIATQIVDGYCANPMDPLAIVNQNYPNIANNQCLQGIAGNANARFEVSIDATRASDFSADSNYFDNVTFGV